MRGKATGLSAPVSAFHRVRVRNLVTSIVVALPIGGLSGAAYAETFRCSAADVSCLVSAIQESNMNGAPSNTIRLQAGTYTLTDIDNQLMGPNGLPAITSALTIRGAGHNATSIVRSSGAPAFRILTVARTGSLTLRGVTLANGNLGGQGGAGLYNAGSTTLRDTSITGNTADDRGAGLLNDGGSIDIQSSSISGNKCFHAGGAVYNDRGVLVVRSSTIADNMSDGGALVTITARAELADSFISRNIGATHIAGVLAVGGTTMISGSTFNQNTGGFGGGGSLELAGGAQVSVNGSAFVENISTLADPASLPPGILVSDAGSMLLVTNTTFAKNAFTVTANSRGIAIENWGTATLLNTTLSENTAPAGLSSALLTQPGAATMLGNTIIAGNSAEDCSGQATSFGSNLLGDPTGCNMVLQPSDLTGDAGLDVFVDDGSAGNGHYSLLPGSSAIGEANRSMCTVRDQIGTRRKKSCSIGAVEFIPAPPGGSLR